MQRSDQKLAFNNRLPSLNFQAGAGFKNGFQPDIEKIRFNYLAGVSLSVPIFQGNRIQQNITMARKSVELNELSKSNITLSLNKDLESVGTEKAKGGRAEIRLPIGVGSLSIPLRSLRLDIGAFA